MQEGNKSLVMLKNVQSGQKIFTLDLVSYITVDFKKTVSGFFFWFTAYKMLLEAFLI